MSLPATQTSQAASKVHPVLSRSYWIRTINFALGSLLILDALPPGPEWVSAVIIFFGFVYPTLFYQIAIRMKNTRAVGMGAFWFDTFLWALAVVITHYSIAVLLIAPMMAVTKDVLMLGLRRASLIFAMMVVVLLLGLKFVEVELTTRFSNTQLVFAWVIVFFFMSYIGYTVNRTTRNFIATRRELQETNQQVMEQAQELASIAKVAQLVNSTLDIDQVMETIKERLSRVFSFSHTAILFLDKGRQILTLDRVSGDMPEALLDKLHGLPIPLTEKNSAFAITAVNAIPHYLPNVSSDAGAAEGNSAEIYKLVPAKSLLTFPLIKDDEVIGVLSFANTENYFHLEQEDIDQIGQYVTYIVSALSNARNYREIMAARSAADSANKAKSQFLANMSHELRTPMNAIIGFSEVLNERIFGELNDKQAEYLTDINAAGQHLLSLINDILDLSKIEAGRLELSLTEFDLTSVIDDAMAMMKERAATGGVTLHTDIDGDLSLITADQRLVKQVLINLLSNAVKFTLEGGSVTLRACKSDTEIEVSIIDTGIGIRKEEMDMLFEEFRQSSDDYTRKQEGTGLGLALSQRLIQLHDGLIRAESEPGQGSTFTFNLPTGGPLMQHDAEEIGTEKSNVGENNGR